MYNAWGNAVDCPREQIDLMLSKLRRRRRRAQPVTGCQEKGAWRIWIEQEGMRVGGCYGRGRQTAGILLVIAGVLIVFLCLPMEFFLIALGVAMAVAGLLLLR